MCGPEEELYAGVYKNQQGRYGGGGVKAAVQRKYSCVRPIYSGFK
jgi:hypothetical protein